MYRYSGQLKCFNQINKWVWCLWIHLNCQNSKFGVENNRILNLRGWRTFCSVSERDVQTCNHDCSNQSLNTRLPLFGSFLLSETINLPRERWTIYWIYWTIKKKSISMIKWKPVCSLVVYRIIIIIQSICSYVSSIDQPLLLVFALVVGSLNFLNVQTSICRFLFSVYVRGISGLDACQLVYIGWKNNNKFQLLMFIRPFKFGDSIFVICWAPNYVRRYVLNIFLVRIHCRNSAGRYYQSVFSILYILHIQIAK